MKSVAQFLLVSTIVGVTDYIQEVHAHKAIEDDDLIVQGQDHLSEQDSLDSSNSGMDDQGDGVFKSREFPDFMDLEIPEKGKTTIKEKLIQFFSHEPTWYWKYYKLECMYLIVILGGIVNFFKGKEQNSNIAWEWRKMAIPSLFQTYTHLGCSKDPKNVQLVQRSYSEFDYFASGRANCYYTLFRLEMTRRHCLLTNYLVDPYLGRQDTLTLQIPIDLKGRDLPLEFLICQKKELKSMIQTHPHLEYMVKNSNTKNYKPRDQDAKSKTSLMVMSEHDEVASQLVTPAIGAELLACGGSGLLKKLHITDQKVYNNYPLFMIAVIQIPAAGNTEEEEKAFKLMHVVLNMIDTIAGVRYSPGVTSKCEKNRKKQVMEAKAKMMEQIEDKKADAKRDQVKLERERLARMTPEQQQKYELKQQKKEKAGNKKKLMKISKN